MWELTDRGWCYKLICIGGEEEKEEEKEVEGESIK